MVCVSPLHSTHSLTRQAAALGNRNIHLMRDGAMLAGGGMGWCLGRSVVGRGRRKEGMYCLYHTTTNVLYGIQLISTEDYVHMVYSCLP